MYVQCIYAHFIQMGLTMCNPQYWDAINIRLVTRLLVTSHSGYSLDKKTINVDHKWDRQIIINTLIKLLIGNKM